MKTQFDNKVRVVSLENLKAMCERCSGTCNGYHIGKVTTNRVHVWTNTSSSESESFGHPVTAVFPAWPSGFDGKENPSVALEIMRVIGETDDDYDASQEFWPLLDCEPLCRSLKDGKELWQSEYEILSATYGYSIESRWYQGCIQFWHVNDATGHMVQTFAPGDSDPSSGTDQQRGEYRDYRKAQADVVSHCRKLSEAK